MGALINRLKVPSHEPSTNNRSIVLGWRQYHMNTRIKIMGHILGLRLAMKLHPPPKKSLR
ncbi:uncharacterized protein QC761_0003650 [Podospora bellae-mahoneyi]|uniref:Uncharacterized protein n=1 Tax=Podospora bellae-mahoneyi TaxID=2093777 RepID=A0ABR0FUR9_9PEZI|nr:hypothetical protein QC761_0003650 [Podospora bellae-mahoneyi]